MLKRFYEKIKFWKKQKPKVEESIKVLSELQEKKKNNMEVD